MAWALMTLVVVGCGVITMLATIGAIARTKSEIAHYSLSIRYWGLLGALGLILMGAFAYPIYAVGGVAVPAGLLTAALTAIMPSVVVFAGLHSAIVLAGAHRRRRRAWESGQSITGTVVARDRRRFAHDLMTVTVQAQVPVAEGQQCTGYRKGADPVVEVQSFVEVCTTDHWERFEPGRLVELRYVPKDPSRFAIGLFSEVDEKHSVATAA